EGRYAQIPREMLERGEWTVPYLQDEPYLDKPPLFYWLVMLSYQLFGVQDWSARLVPALFVHGSILITYLFGRPSLGERAAFWGSLALTLAPAFVGMGRLLLLDGVLAFWVTLAIFSSWEAMRGRGETSPQPLSLGERGSAQLHWGWWLISAIACGLG